MADLFISYSRKDIDFARRLHAALVSCDHKVWVDWEDIPPTAEWLQEIYTGIEGSDTFIFVISPDSASSEVCAKEIKHALTNNKRIAPILRWEVPKNAKVQDIYSSIESRNWIYFRDTDDFDQALQTLLSAIDTDLPYVRTHKQLLTKAVEWKTKQRDKSLLLRGDELSQAEKWLTQYINQEPRPTLLHSEYIVQSRRAAARFQRSLLSGVSGGLAITLIALTLAVVFWRQSEGRLDIAEANLHQAWNTQSLFLADLAEQQAEPGNARNAVLTALEGLSHYSDGIFNPENHQALLDALATPGLERLVLRHEGRVLGALWNADETRLLTWSTDGTAKMWDSATGKELFTLHHDPSGFGVRGVTWNADETRLLTWSDDGTARIWDASDGTELLTLREEEAVRGAVWNQDESQILTRSNSPDTCLENCQFQVRIWDAVSGEALVTLNHKSFIHGAVWNYDETQVLTWENMGTAHLWDADSGEELIVLHQSEDDGPVRSASWNHDGTIVLTVAWGSGVVRLWDSTSGDLLLALHPSEGAMGALWNRTESRLLTWGRTAQLWDPNTGEELLTIQPESMLNGAAWNTDETRLLTWEFNGAIQVWDATTGEEILTVRNTNDGLVGALDALWNHNETRLLTVAYDNPARVWDAISGEVLLTLSQDDYVSGAVWNQDETQLLTWSNDGTARVWEIGSSLPVTIQREESIARAEWSRDGSVVFTWPRYNNDPVRAWNASTGEEMTTSEDEIRAEGIVVVPDESRVRGRAWNRDKTRLVTWLWDDTAHLWDATSGEELLTLTHPDPSNGTSAILGASWNADASKVLTWSYMDDSCEVNCAYAVRGWDVATGEIITGIYIYPQASEYEALAGIPEKPLSTDGTRLLSWTNSVYYCTGDYCFYNVVIWDVNTGTELLTFAHKASINGAAWNQDSTKVLSWSADDTVRVWDATSGAEVLTLSSEGSVKGAIWNHDETRILTWSADDTVRIWDATTGEELFVLRHGSDLFKTGILGAVWNQSETKILTWSNDGTTHIWDATNGQALLTLYHKIPVLNATWNVDETRIMTQLNDGTVRVWLTDIDQMIAQARKLNLRPLTDEERAEFFLP